MFKLEKRIVDFLKENSNLLFLIAITVISVFIRITGADYVSNDMNVYLLPWYEKIKACGGFAALGEQVGDYNIPYQTVIALLTYINIKPIYLYKIFSILFDYALAVTAAYGLCKILNRGFEFFNIVYTVLLFLPTVIINSAFWGQCDALYSFFIILFLFRLYSKKYFGAFISLGIAFAFKFQTIFIVPFVVCYYLYKKKFSILYFFIRFGSFWLCSIIGILNGRGFFEPISLYLKQTETYKQMWLNVTSFWQLLGDDYQSFSKLAILITLTLCGIGLYLILKNKKKIDTAEQFFNTAAWFVWIMVFFLPAMHERYTFLLDILLVILSFISVKYVKYAILSVLLSLATYGHFLTGISQLDILFVFIYFAALAYYSYEILVADKTSAEINLKKSNKNNAFIG